MKLDKNKTFVLQLVANYVQNEDILIDSSFSWEKFKQIFDGQRICLDFCSLNLNNCIFGKIQNETKNLQKQNCKSVFKVFKLLKKIVKYINKKPIGFNNTFYYFVDKRKNNNDKMLEYLLNLKFVNYESKLSKQIEFACEYLDGEMSIANACDFKDGKCKKYSGCNINKSSCCKAGCKYGVPCTIKNIACKLFMCDVLHDMGFCFYVQYIPLLKYNMTFLDRAICKSTLFVPLQNVVKLVKISRVILSVVVVAIISVIVVGVLKFI